MVSKMEIKWNAQYGKRTKKRKEIEWEWLTTKMEEALRTIKEKREAEEQAKGEEKEIEQDSTKKVTTDESEHLSPHK